jgi:hypothetical protein
MSPSRDSKKARLLRRLEAEPSTVIDEPGFRELKSQLAPISDSYLRKLLRESGAPLSPLVEGVSLASFDALERTLVGLADAYSSGAVHARALVIESKVRLRWAESRASDEARRAEKREMLLWVLTWLENPVAFPVWLRLRKHVAPEA